MTPVFIIIVCLALTSAAGSVVKRDVFDAIAEANKGTGARLGDGDIMPNRRRNALPCTAAGCKWPKTGRYVWVPVRISPAYSRQERNRIIQGLETFQGPTCIRFQWHNGSKHQDYINFISNSGCWSYLGRQGGRQDISLQKRGCLRTDIIQHEVFHALGFAHEQSRSDRDDYVTILFNNIQSGRERNFRKARTNNLGTDYDFDSIMHYSSHAFSKNGSPTIIAKSKPNARLGTASSMTDKDIALVNRLYEC